MHFSKILLLATAVALLPLSCGPKDYSVKGNTVTVKLQAPAEGGPAQVRLQVLGEKIIRVSATPDKKFNDRKSLVVLPVKGRRTLVSPSAPSSFSSCSATLSCRRCWTGRS